MVRCVSSTPHCPPCKPCFERTICCSSPPTTGTTRRLRPRTTRVSACRCWRSGTRFVRVISEGVRPSRIWARPSASGSASSIAAAEHRSSISWLLARMQVDPRPLIGGELELPGDERTLQNLRERAFAAMDRAYAPYSNFKVGAALLASDGSITDGCNVENAAYPAGICAERGAVAGAVARGNQSFAALLIATEADEPTPPCGISRQVLEGFP